jgi:hypothetical protein
MSEDRNMSSRLDDASPSCTQNMNVSTAITIFLVSRVGRSEWKPKFGQA